MKRRPTFVASLGLAATFLLAAGSSGIELQRSVIASGGGSVAGATRRCVVTLGEPLTGGSFGQSYYNQAGFWVPMGFVALEPESVEPEHPIPLLFALSTVRPNPVDAVSVIDYAVPRCTDLSIKLYDVRGRVVRTLLEGSQSPGYHKVELRAVDLPGGIYFCRMEAPGFAKTRKVLLVR